MEVYVSHFCFLSVATECRPAMRLKRLLCVIHANCTCMTHNCLCASIHNRMLYWR